VFDVAGLASSETLAAEVRGSVLPPPPVLTVSEWADTKRVLGSEETSEPGQWKTDRVPYLRAIMDAFSDPEVRTVVVKGSARIGKTEFFNNVIGFTIDQDPCPFLLVYPSEGKAKDFSKEKLAPMLRNTPALRGKVREAKSRDSGNTLLNKQFQGGYIAMVGSNTPNGLDSRTCRIVAFDELDKAAKSAKNLGDPRALAKNRTLTYPGRYKHLFVSTPSEEGDSPITEEYEKTNMQRLYLPCAHCGEFDILHVDWIDWPENHPEEATYTCHHCGAQISDADKSGMLARHEWRAERPGITEAQGFALNALYSPWTTWAQIAKAKVEAAHAGPEQLKVFINEWLGENWKPNQGQDAKVEGLLKRARESRYISGVVPNECGILFGAVDVQGDRVELLVRGVGVGEKQWTIKHEVIPGNLAMTDPWDRLEKLILSTWERADGQQMKIRKLCLDVGGNHGKEAWAFCRRQSVKGVVVPARGNKYPQKRPAIRSKRKSTLWLLDGTQLKDTIHGNLKIDIPEFAGYQSFPNDLEASYFQQLTVERKVKGHYNPVPDGAPNEIADLHAYVDGAMHIYGLRKNELEDLVDYYAKGKGRKKATTEEAPSAPSRPVRPPRPSRIPQDEAPSEDVPQEDKPQEEAPSTPPPARTRPPRPVRPLRIRTTLPGW
jgi:phage terminase large subunit GpA-like protein